LPRNEAENSPQQSADSALFVPIFGTSRTAQVFLNQSGYPVLLKNAQVFLLNKETTGNAKPFGSGRA
jgi:hypothetical protein